MKNDQSQNGEAGIVLEYFKGYTGRLLDIGCNDGKTFSNSFNLINEGWAGLLLDPSPKAFFTCALLHYSNKNVEVGNYGIGLQTERVKFYESGPHLPNGSDTALLSGIKIQDKWTHLQYEEVEAQMKTFYDAGLENQVWDFISIDCEGEDRNVLQQIDLEMVGCRCLCIEHNGDEELLSFFISYAGSYGLKEIHRNAENIIFAL